MAIDDYTEAIRLNPNRADTYIDRGLAYKKQGNPFKAGVDFAEAKRLEAGQ